MAQKLFDKNENDSESKNSFINQIESFDAYNIILDRNSKKNEDEVNIMKKYDILNDENVMQEDDNNEIREKIKEHMNNLNSKNKEKTLSMKGKNNTVRIRSGNFNNTSGIKNLKVQTNNNRENQNERIEADEFKRFLSKKKQGVSGQMSYDYTEHL